MTGKKRVPEKKVVKSAGGIAGPGKTVKQDKQAATAYRIPLETTGAGVATINREGIITCVNDRTCALSGYSREELLSANFKDFIYKSDLSRVMREFLATVEGSVKGGMMQFRLVSKNGKNIMAYCNAEPVIIDGEITGISAYIYDIADLKNLAYRLEKAEQQLDSYFENAPDGVYMYDLKTRLIYVNRKCEELFGYRRDEMVGSTFMQLNAIDEKSLATANELFKQNRKGIGTGPDELYLRTKEGRCMAVEVTTSVVQRDEEKVVLAFLRDISERKKIELALRQSEAQYRLLSDHVKDTVWLMDMDLNIIYQSPSVQRTRGFTPREISEMPLEKHLTPESFKLASEIYLEEMAKLNADPAYDVSRVVDLEFTRKDGTTLWSENTLSLIRGDDGKPVAILGEGRDVTERKQAEKALRESEERWKFALEGAGDGIWDWNVQTNHVYFSRRWKEMLGYEDDEIGNTFDEWDKRIHPDDRDRVYDDISQHFEGKVSTFVSEHRLLCKDGTYKWILDRGKIVSQTPEGKPLRVIGTHSDISERKFIEEALKESEQKYRMLVENSHEGIFIVAGNNLIFANASTEKISGYSNEEIRSRPFWEFIHPEDRQLVMNNQYKRAILRLSDELTFRIISCEGEVRWVELTTVPIKWKGEAATLCFLGDITDRKRAEISLRLSESLYRSLIEISPHAIGLMDINGTILMHNKQALEVFGFEPTEDLRGKNVMDMVAPENFQVILDNLERLRKSEVVRNLEIQSYKKDGRLFNLEISSSMLFDEDGKPKSIMTVFQDITDRKTAEELLRKSEEKYRLLAEHTTDFVWLMDMQLNTIYQSPSIEKLTGYTQEELEGLPLEKRITPESIQKAMKIFVEELPKAASNPYYNPVVTIELQGYRKDGTLLWTENVISLIRDPDGKPASILGEARDITDRKRLEEERQRVAKLESIGLLAAGIAHDFNNILTAILGNISLARLDAVPGSDLYTSLDQAEKASLRAKDLTQQLLTFAKGGAPVKKLASIDQLLRDTASFALRGSNVRCRFSIPQDLWYAEIDTGQISQVIHNLTVNAQQAMPDGGTIEIVADNVVVNGENSQRQSLPLLKGNYIRVAVIDHGSGIPEEYHDRIFDPFFSTKQMGTGLGLATSFSIVRNHGGYISLESKLGCGSTFYVYLPASPEMCIIKQQDGVEIKHDGRARILLMDDEEDVRKTCGRLLSYLGYNDVEYASDGEEAIAMYKKAMASGCPFDLVIMDLTIPGGMGGDSAINELLKVDPGTKAVVSSGYSDEAVMSDYRKFGFVGTIAKPYTVQELSKVLYDVIGK